jgi:hypothetical protein
MTAYTEGSARLWLKRIAWFLVVFPLALYSPFEFPGASENLSYQILGWIACLVWFVLPAAYWESECRFCSAHSVRDISIRVAAYVVGGSLACIALLVPLQGHAAAYGVSRYTLKIGMCVGAASIVFADLCFFITEKSSRTKSGA